MPNTPESKASQDIELTAPKLGVRLLRNNNGACQDATGRLIRYGLGNTSKRVSDQIKSSDFIGITPVVITPDMVGKTVGVFTAIEAKPEGFKVRAEYNRKSREWAQENFLQFVRDNGGFAGFCTSGKSLEHVINHYLKWLKNEY